MCVCVCVYVYVYTLSHHRKKTKQKKKKVSFISDLADMFWILMCEYGDEYSSECCMGEKCENVAW